MNKGWTMVAGGAAGLVNGCFGGGGGMVLLPILDRTAGLSQRTLYATCVGIIFPVCLVSACIYLFQGSVSVKEAIPYLAGGLAGGWLGGRLYRRVDTKWLRLLFAGFLIYAGVRYLL